MTVKRILCEFIKSWFTLVETLYEYEISRKEFHIYKNFNNGDHAILSIDELEKKLHNRKKYLYHYNFKGKTTFGFKGDSIVEASFASTKQNQKLVSSRKSIDHSAMNLINNTVERQPHESCKGQENGVKRCMVKF